MRHYLPNLTEDDMRALWGRASGAQRELYLSTFEAAKPHETEELGAARHAWGVVVVRTLDGEVVGDVPDFVEGRPVW